MKSKKIEGLDFLISTISIKHKNTSPLLALDKAKTMVKWPVALNQTRQVIKLQLSAMATECDISRISQAGKLWIYGSTSNG